LNKKPQIKQGLILFYTYKLMNQDKMSSPESLILHMASSYKSCTITIPESVVLKIQSIKDAVIKIEGDSQSLSLGWRKGNPHVRNTGHGHGHGHNHNNNHVNNKSDWRSGHRSIPPRQNMGTSNNLNQSNLQSQGQGQGITHQRYVSRFRDSQTPVEDTILNTIILNKLNKFSEVNYDDIKQFLKQVLDSEDTSFLKEFMKLIFKKAASEQTFCPLYARLICELSSQYTSLQKEFIILYKDYLSIFEDIDESKCADYETFVKRNSEKLYRLGYSQFLAELISKGVLASEDLILLFSKILEQVSNASRQGKDNIVTIDEYIQCILRMTRGLKNTEILHNINCFEEPIEYLIQNQATEFPGLSKKSVFALMDCLDILRGFVKG
jgi:hypothetical protein